MKRKSWLRVIRIFSRLALCLVLDTKTFFVSLFSFSTRSFKAGDLTKLYQIRLYSIMINQNNNELWPITPFNSNNTASKSRNQKYSTFINCNRSEDLSPSTSIVAPTKSQFCFLCHGDPETTVFCKPEVHFMQIIPQSAANAANFLFKLARLQAHSNAFNCHLVYLCFRLSMKATALSENLS